MSYVNHPDQIPVRSVCLHSSPNKKTTVPKSRELLRSHVCTRTGQKSAKGLCLKYSRNSHPNNLLSKSLPKSTVLMNPRLRAEIRRAVKMVKWPQQRLVDKVWYLGQKTPVIILKHIWDYGTRRWSSVKAESTLKHLGKNITSHRENPTLRLHLKKPLKNFCVLSRLEFWRF